MNNPLSVVNFTGVPAATGFPVLSFNVAVNTTELVPLAKIVFFPAVRAIEAVVLPVPSP